MDITPYQGVGDPPPPGGYSPVLCRICDLSTWVEIGGGPASDVFHPNVDMVAGEGVDFVIDLERDPLPFHDGHATQVKAIHSLQHMSRNGARHALEECYRIMLPGAGFYAMLGDFDFIVERLAADGLEEGWMNCVFHGTAIEERLGYHRWGYNYKTISEELTRVGLRNITYEGRYNAWEFKVSAIK